MLILQTVHRVVVILNLFSFNVFSCFVPQANILRHRVRTSTYGKNSFEYAAAVLWNDLPDDFRKISNFNQFKNILKSWNGNVCKCSACADF